ncbi:MAG: hypothetical protein AB1611_20495 [bacterium]
MDRKKVWLWLLLTLVIVCMVPGARGAEGAESSLKSVYIYKEFEGKSCRQDNLRLSIKSRYSLVISVRVGTQEGASRWINFTTTGGSPSYQAELIEIPLGSAITDGAWHEVELPNLNEVLSQGGDSYDHLEKIGIRGADFQLGDIELFSGDANAPSSVQVMSFDDPTISDITRYGWYTNDSSAKVALHYLPEGNYLQASGQTPPASSSQTTQQGQQAANSSSSSNQALLTSFNEGWYNNYSYPASSNYYSFSDYSSWTSGPVYPPYVPPPRTFQPLFGLGYPPGTPPYGFGPQPVLSLLTRAGLPAYFSDPNPGYPYSAGGYNFNTLFATGSSPYPYASPFPAQSYGYLASPLAPVDPTYNIYTSPLTTTLAPAATLSGLLTAISTGGGGGGGPGFAGGALI